MSATQSWATVEAAMSGTLMRRWYTNHGPIAQAFERHAAEASGVKHAIGVTNPTIGLIMLAEALALSGNVLVSALAPRRCVQALAWAGLHPVFGDVDAGTLGFDRRALRADADLCAVLGIPGTENTAQATLVETLGLAYFGDGLVGLHVPSMVKVPCEGDTAGLGCVTTDDDRLAARLRNIRSSYGAGPAVPVVRTANGRMSEIQAAMAISGLAAWAAAPGQLGLLRDVLRGWRVFPFADGAAVVMDEPTQRDRLLAELTGAGVAACAPVIDRRAATCHVAMGLAARMMTIPLQSAADPALVQAARRVR